MSNPAYESTACGNCSHNQILAISLLLEPSVIHLVIVLCNGNLYYYIKSTKTKQANTIGHQKSYIPNETLVNFIQEWLQLHRKKDRLAKEGKDLSREEQLKIRELTRMKVYVLDTIIFPAMADLTYFFDSLSVSKKLSELFDDDVEELLDPRGSAEAARFSGNDMRLSSIQFRRNNLARLVMAMLSMHEDKSNPKKRVTDFRVGLLYQLLNIVGDITDRLLAEEFSLNQVWRSYYEDYVRMKGWLSLLAGTSEIKLNEHDRRIGFLPIWYSNKANLASFEL